MSNLTEKLDKEIEKRVDEQIFRRAQKFAEAMRSVGIVNGSSSGMAVVLEIQKCYAATPGAGWEPLVRRAIANTIRDELINVEAGLVLGQLRELLTLCDGKAKQ